MTAPPGDGCATQHPHPNPGGPSPAPCRSSTMGSVIELQGLRGARNAIGHTGAPRQPISQKTLANYLRPGHKSSGGLEVRFEPDAGVEALLVAVPEQELVDADRAAGEAPGGDEA